MEPAQQRTVKEKVTITLRPKVLRAVDRWCRAARLRSRSAAIEDLLEQSIVEKERQRLEAEMEAYYRSLTPSEKGEDLDWVQISSSEAIRRFEKE